jgi:hypothetical protein
VNAKIYANRLTDSLVESGTQTAWLSLMPTPIPKERKWTKNYGGRRTELFEILCCSVILCARQSSYFLSAVAPYTGQCLHIGSALYRYVVVYILP